MVFSSIIFMFTFLPISLLIYYIVPKSFKNLVLLIISLIFYAWGEPIYVLLMMGTIVIDYTMALFIDKNKNNKLKRKVLFIFTVSVNILILSFFKYYGFIVDNINIIFNLDIEIVKLALPIGISFYTFQTLSYIVDVYLEKVKVQKNLVSFALYVTMFPQLVAGPIVKYSDIEEQLVNRNIDDIKFGKGVDRFIRGLAKKVLLANNIGIVWNLVQEMPIKEVSVVTSWIGIIAYTFQIYFDFSGYSDMAIGIGKMFGFEFMENFNYPYISTSVTEFWRRWHISLGGWFREYVYIPLGGNRVSIKRNIVNLFIVWMLTGLWHGASWNFVAWGTYYGAILLLEKTILKEVLEKCPKVIKHTYTMLLVMVGWTLFGCENLQVAVQYLKVMFGLTQNVLIDSTAIYYLYTNIILLIVLTLCSTPIISITLKNIMKISNWYGVVFKIGISMTTVLLAVAYLVNETYNPFLYFRF